MYIQIQKAKLVKDTFGQHVALSHIGLYEDDGKWIRWVKHTEELIELLKTAKIQVPK
jgi:hypothetical protein